MAKLFYSTDEVCEHLDIPKTTLEYYIREFKLNIQKSGRDRKFTTKDIEKIQKIVDLLKTDGYTIGGTKDQLKQKAVSENKTEEVILRLQEIRKSLVFLRNGIDS